MIKGYMKEKGLFVINMKQFFIEGNCGFVYDKDN